VNGANWALLVVVVVLFVLSIWLAVAETAFVRMSRIRALALADEGQNKRAHRLASMLERPEQTLNVVLLLVLVSQLTSADALLGEAILGYVVAGPGVRLEKQRILAACFEELPRFKLPKYLRVVKELPRTSSGKLRRGELAEWFARGEGEPL
jgi:acyl-CoA synthetase (AMP-forming)/AMP-acid ligase II